MVNQRSLSFGDVLAGRYVLQDQVSESLGVRNWRATDQQLHRNVRVELLSADDDRAENFIEAAQRSTVVTDHRFLPVLDLLTNEQGFHAVVREWARATPLHLLVAQAPLSNERTAVLVAELSEAIAHAHSLGVHHRRLTPHQVLLKQTGAVRIVGLGVQTALAPPEQHVSDSDIERYVTSDVQALGKVLYACLVGRWPGGHVDGLRAAPTEHGHLMRPRQVRAGISRRLDNICDRILQPERHPRDALTDAASIAAELRALTGFHDVVVAPARQSDETDTDLLRQDPVVVPFGPPPGLEPPRRRPKALQRRPPSKRAVALRRLKSTTRGHRLLLVVGLGLGVVLAVALGDLGYRVSQVPQVPSSSESAVKILPVSAVYDFDPQGTDDSERPDLVQFAVDGDPSTGWQTSTYFGSPTFGGLKDGVGLVLDLGSAHEVQQVRVRLRGEPTDLSVRVAPATATRVPRSLGDTRNTVSANRVGSDIAMALGQPQFTRYVVVWVRSLPEITPGEYRAEITEVVIRGR